MRGAGEEGPTLTRAAGAETRLPTARPRASAPASAPAGERETSCVSVVGFCTRQHAARGRRKNVQREQAQAASSRVPPRLHIHTNVAMLNAPGKRLQIRGTVCEELGIQQQR